MAIPRAVQAQADKADEMLRGLQENEPEGEEVEAEEEQQEVVESKPVIDWEHKFRVLQGKYDAEVPRLSQELRDIRDQLNNAQKQREQQEEQSLRPNFEDLKEIADEEVVTAFQKQQEIIDRQNQVIAELKQRVDAVGNSTIDSSQKMFYATLEQIVPDWKAVNNDQRFLSWLGEVDPYSGLQRQQMLIEAANNMDAQRAAVFFTSWKDSVKKKTPPISPNSSKSSTPPQDKKTYSAAEIKKFADDVTKGKYRHNPDERKRLEDEYTRAQMEGRITP